MKRSLPQRHISALALLLPTSILAEPIISSWYTEDGGSYARIWQTIEDETSEKGGGATTSVTTWDAADFDDNPRVGDQPKPVYAGVQGVSYSSDFVYIKSTGLATNTMGPWYSNLEKTGLFPSFPGNAAILYRFPRSTTYGADYISPKNTSGLGTNGLAVDGVPIFNSSDGMSFNDAGVWNRDAYFNEGNTFDAGNAHQAMENFHYHANAPALRFSLGDNIAYDPTVVYRDGNTPYSEAPDGEHSPIVGWINDGLPIYGPYGYSDPEDATSDVRLMVTGYQMRDGTNGSYDLPANGRNLLPQWVVNIGGKSSTAAASDGPDVSEDFVLGNYIEDYAYKGDLGLVLGTDFDLNEYNVRYCVTPEFPEGTWAYFTCILADGTPTYPYNVGNNYFGDNSLASGISEIPDTEIITTVFEGGATKSPSAVSQEVGNEVTITWDGSEGGIYRFEESADLSTWSEGESFTADSSVILQSASPGFHGFFRIVQIGLADYDDNEFSSATGGGPGGPGGGGPPM